MGFVKVIKNKAYYSRYQVKFRRRREAKTDYYARRRLLIQDKNKYNTPKFRFVVRFSNRDITCQIVSADIDHDVVVASAYSHELSRYGITVGLTNYAAAYCTGLLLARRVNEKYKLGYEGAEEVSGEEYHVEEDVEEDEKARPFKALLDVGLAPTTTGSKIFGALKGATDGGLHVPHNGRRFPGSVKGDGHEWEGNPDVHRNYIFGANIAARMTQLKNDDPAKFAKQFSRYIAAKISPEDIEGMYEAAHAAIRKDPNIKRGDKELGSFKTRKFARKSEYPKKHWKLQRRSLQQRQGRIRQILTARGIKYSAKIITRQSKTK